MIHVHVHIIVSYSIGDFFFKTAYILCEVYSPRENSEVISEMCKVC